MSITPEFPAPGSRASWDGVPVRIHQWNIDGTALVFGPGVARRVEADALQPIDAGEAFPRWLADRVAAQGATCFTATAELYDDYRAWSETSGVADFRIYSRIAFARFLTDHGFAHTRRPVGLFRTGFQHGYCLTLRRADAVAA